jgi:hypothetical protein
VTIDMNPTPSRRAVRASVVALGLGLALVATPAQAAPPETWDVPDNGSVLWNLLVLVGIPLAVVLLLTLLVYLPVMTRKQSSESAFGERAEWFGGPRKGVEAATGGPDSHATSDSLKGGAGGQW